MTKAKGWIPGFGWGSPSASWSPSGRRWSESWPRASWDSSNRTAPGLFHRRAGFRRPWPIPPTKPCFRHCGEIRSGSAPSWRRSPSAGPLENVASCEWFPSPSTDPVKMPKIISFLKTMNVNFKKHIFVKIFFAGLLNLLLRAKGREETIFTAPWMDLRWDRGARSCCNSPLFSHLSMPPECVHLSEWSSNSATLPGPAF